MENEIHDENYFQDLKEGEQLDPEKMQPDDLSGKDQEESADMEQEENSNQP